MSWFRGILIIGLIACAAAVASGETRNWSDRSGKFRIEASFVAVKEGKVYLEKKDGKIVTVSLAQLSDEDVKYVQSLPEAQEYFRQHPLPAEPGGTAPAEPREGAQDSTPEEGASSGGVLKIATEVARLSDPGRGVKSLAFSCDGKRLAVGRADQTLLLYDAAKGQRLSALEHMEGWGQVTCVQFTPDGRKLLAGNSNGRIQICTVDPAGQISAAERYLGHDGEVQAICVSADGKNVLSGGNDKKVCYWELNSRREFFTLGGFEGNVLACHLTPHKKQGLATDGKTLTLIDVPQGKILEKMELGSLSPRTAAISPDGKCLAVNNFSSLYLWEICSGEALPVLGGHELLLAAAFAARGKYLLAGGRGKVALWAVKDGRKIQEIPMEERTPVSEIAVSPDGRNFAVAADLTGRAIQVFRLAPE